MIITRVIGTGQMDVDASYACTHGLGPPGRQTPSRARGPAEPLSCPAAECGPRQLHQRRQQEAHTQRSSRRGRAPARMRALVLRALKQGLAGAGAAEQATSRLVPQVRGGGPQAHRDGGDGGHYYITQAGWAHISITAPGRARAASATIAWPWGMHGLGTGPAGWPIAASAFVAAAGGGGTIISLWGRAR